MQVIPLLLFFIQLDAAAVTNILTALLHQQQAVSACSDIINIADFLPDGQPGSQMEPGMACRPSSL
ncbi:hypothetical protein ACO0LF_27495 [Undibacterium sp. Di27W]|uniref:hypothetical protein n=1 Tax=Undibacterium sp. Di27W TaxID=3413036 RepID=UPI003BF45689